jgi:hypothetical protein
MGRGHESADARRLRESGMSKNISQSMLPEFDMEMANTRRTLERVPEGRPDFRPHEKSMPLVRLAGHLTELPGWAGVAINQDVFDVNPPGGRKYEPMIMKSRDDLLKTFDENVKQARAALEAATDDR